MTEKYDDVLLPFLSLMRKELHANSRKGDRPGWLAMSTDVLLLEIYWHAAKLSAAVKNNDGPGIAEYSADVANMAMMVLDRCGGIEWIDYPHGVPATHPGDELGNFARWFVTEYGYAPDHRDQRIVEQFKAWCAARNHGVGVARDETFPPSDVDESSPC